MKKRINLSFVLILLIQTNFLFGQILSPNTTGSFVFTPTGALSSKPITVYYHIPNGNISTMPILFSLHGDERNASDYRDYWISMANDNGFMVFAPEYSETHYPGGDGYQLGNVFDDGDNPSLSTLNPTNEWTFSTIDPLFENIKTNVSGTQQNYDAWGHSGGAQFLQRFRMYLPNSKLNTAICSNAGWYTVPESAIDFPYGINNGQLSNGNLTIALSKKLIVHLGLNDTDPNSLGLRHNTTVDNQQGLFRLARGRYFFNTSLAFSQTLSNNFNWQREEVTGVGHDPQLMANDALRFLFQPNVNNISYSILDGGFENQSSTLGGGSGGVLVLNGSTWTANTTGNVVRTSVATSGRTGPRYVSLGSTNGTAKNFFSPQIPAAFAPNTTYQIQFWYKSASTTTLDASSVDLYVDNNSTTAAGTKQSTPIVLLPNVATWTKISTSITTNGTTSSTNGVAGLTIDAPTAGYSADFDDFVIYQANATDNTAPNSPGAITATGASNGGSNVSWVSASGGVDGGGYVVVRYATTAPSTSDDLVQNGIYKFANTFGAGVVRYIGSGTSFTDSGLSPGLDYYYKVYTVDKAFNYSDESVTSTSVQSLATTYYYKGTGLLTDVTSWGQNTNGTGTAPLNFTDASQVFEIRNTTAVALDGVWTVGTDPTNGTKVRLGNTDQPAITLTLNSSSSIGPSGTGNFDVMPSSSGHQTVIYKNTTALSLGSILDTDFEVIYDGVTVSSSSTKSFGTISMINGANVTFSSSISINNLSIASGTTTTFSSTPSVTNSIINGTLVAPTNSSSYIVIPSGGSLTVNGTIKIPRLSGFVSSLLGTANTTTLGTNIQFLGSENLTLGSNSTVEYLRTATGAQTVTARTDYKNVIFTGTTPKTVNGPTIISGTLTINQSTAITLTGDVTVNGTLSFLLGKITTGNNILTIGASGTITGANQSTGWIVGNLKKQTASSASPSFAYTIGDSNNYTPLALTFSGTTSATGGLTAKINIGDHAQVASSGIDVTKSVNKTWTLTNDSLADFGTYSAAFGYSSADIDGTSTPANYLVAQYDGSTWSNGTVSGTPTDSATTATGISGFGDFAIGECAPTTIGSVTVSQCGGTYTWPVNETTYSASETLVVSSGCNTATLNLTITAPTTTGSETISQCGGTYTWQVNNVTYSASETVVVTSDCNTATLNLTITAPTTNGNVTQVQTGGTYTWVANETTYSTSGIYTHVVGCNTATLNLTINSAVSDIPVSFDGFCKGATIASAKGSTSMKFYTAISGTAAALATNTALETKTYYVTETINEVESSPRVARAIVVNNLPVTPGTITTTDAVLCKHIGTENTVTYTVPEVANTTYNWNVTTGINIVADASATDNSITLNFLNATPLNIATGGVGTISAKSVSLGCESALPRLLVLTSKLPTAPTALTMTSEDTTPSFKGIITPATESTPAVYGLVGLNTLAKITKVGPYIGTETVFTMTAPVAVTAASYLWTLPEGVNQLSGGTSNEITVNFAGVGPGTTALPIVVQSVGGCGNSTNRTLTLARAIPTAPTALTLMNSSQANLSSLLKITKVAPYTDTEIPFTLTATPFTTQGGTATSYAWVLPAGVVCTTPGVTATTVSGSTVIETVPTPWTYIAISSPTNTITVNFSGVTGSGNLDLKVFGVNGAGNSIARTLTLARALPTAPTKLVLTDNAISTTVALTKVGPYTAKETPLTLTATPFTTQGAEATSFNWVLPAGVNVTAGHTNLTTPETDINGNKTWTSTGAVLTINLAGISGTSPSMTSIPLNVYAVNGAGTSATTRTLTVTSAVPTAPTITAGASTFSTCASTTTTYTATAIPGATYTWGLPNGATGTSTTNSIVVDFTGVTTASSYAITCIATNGTGPSSPKSLIIKKSTAACRLTPEASVADDFSVIAYPNPSSSEFIIETSAKGAMSVKVYDMQGRLVEKTNTDKVGSRLSSGAYNVIVNQGANTKSVRVIKK